MTTQITLTSPEGVTFGGISGGPGHVIGGARVTWDTLRAAATQEDTTLAAQYSDILERAKQAEESRLVAEDWKSYGYPLRTGYNDRESGQIVSRAWEIRRIQRPRIDVRVAYIVTYDRSDRTITRTASPELPDYDAAWDWVRDNYGMSSRDMGGERTASMWFTD